MARRTAAPDTVLALDRIEREAEQLNTLIGELLALSLLESATAFHQESVDLTTLVEEIVHDADFEAAGGNRRVELVGSTALTVSGNRELLRRALENVIRNAIRHTAPETTVTVTLARQDDGLAILRVRDHGTGVPEEALTEIFRPFYRIEEARDRQSGGSGIGLAITEQTVRRLNGSVTARNHEYGGLGVSVYLPAQKA